MCDNVPQRNCDVTRENNVKLTPKTECNKVEVQLCGPEACPIVKGERICTNEIRTVRLHNSMKGFLW